MAGCNFIQLSEMNNYKKPNAMETNKDQHEAKHSNEEQFNASKHTHAHTHDEEDKEYVSEDKYLAMEQKGVSYTKDQNPVQNSDQLEIDSDETRSDTDKWKANSANSRNADAFNQDDYILNDNIDLDEDQSQSISSEDDFDTNTLDETR